MAVAKLDRLSRDVHFISGLIAEPAASGGACGQRADDCKVRLLRSTFWGVRACAKQTPADCFLNERKRLLGMTRFRLGCLRTELHRR